MGSDVSGYPNRLLDVPFSLFPMHLSKRNISYQRVISQNIAHLVEVGV